VWAIDGLGSVYEVLLEETQARQVTGTIQAEHKGLNEPEVPTILLQGLVGQSKMDWLVEKATELGVTEIRPLLGGPRIGPGRLKRWQRIVRSAAKQCRRSRVPTLFDPGELRTHLADIPLKSVRLLADLTSAPGFPKLDAGSPIVLAVGPEKGFDPVAREALLAASFLPVSLGPRRLRAETAAVCLLSLVAHLRDRSALAMPWPPSGRLAAPDIP
jgi:16S rRNA (uracil1498-N3)-methyltransferase